MAQSFEDVLSAVDSAISSVPIEASDTRSSQKLRAVILGVAEYLMDKHGWRVVLTKRWGRGVAQEKVLNRCQSLASLLCVPLLPSILGIGRSIFSYIKSPSPSKMSHSGDQSQVSALRALLGEALAIAFAAMLLPRAALQTHDLEQRLCQLVVAFLRYRSSVLITFSHTVKEVTPLALSMISCCLLGVNGLSDEVKAAINTVVESLYMEIAHFDGRSDRDLEVHVKYYFQWLRQHSGYLMQRCRIVELIEAVEPSLRAWLKGEEYSSPQHILDIYNRKYRTKLEHLQLPVPLFDRDDVAQSIKDFEREMVMLNGDAVQGNDAIPRMRELIAAALQTGSSESSGTTFANEQVHAELVDNVLRYVLIAGSRTIAGGDAYFVLEDLYGSEGLMFTPETYPIDPSKLTSRSSSDSEFATVEHSLGKIIKLRPSSPVAQSLSSDSLLEIDKRKRSTSNEVQSVLVRNSVNVVVKNKGVTVVLTESYDLICRADVERSAREDVDILPLISFDLSIKTVIKFDTVFQALQDATAAVALSVPSGDGASDTKKLLDVLREQFFLAATGCNLCTRYLGVVPRLFSDVP